MKAIVLFKPETGGVLDLHPVEMLQDQAQCILGDYVRTRYPRQPTRSVNIAIQHMIISTLTLVLVTPNVTSERNKSNHIYKVKRRHIHYIIKDDVNKIEHTQPRDEL